MQAWLRVCNRLSSHLNFCHGQHLSNTGEQHHTQNTHRINHQSNNPITIIGYSDKKRLGFSLSCYQVASQVVLKRGDKKSRWMTKTHGTVLFMLFYSCLITLIKRQNVSPVPAHHVEFVAYGPELIGISVMIPTAPTMLACGLAADIFGRKLRGG